jgi:hypothetical protein
MIAVAALPALSLSLWPFHIWLERVCCGARWRTNSEHWNSSTTIKFKLYGYCCVLYCGDHGLVCSGERLYLVVSYSIVFAPLYLYYVVHNAVRYPYSFRGRRTFYCASLVVVLVVVHPASRHNLRAVIIHCGGIPLGLVSSEAICPIKSALPSLFTAFGSSIALDLPQSFNIAVL